MTHDSSLRTQDVREFGGQGRGGLVLHSRDGTEVTWWWRPEPHETVVLMMEDHRDGYNRSETRGGLAARLVLDARKACGNANTACSSAHSAADQGQVQCGALARDTRHEARAGG